MPLQVKKVQLKVKDGNQYVDGDMLFNVDAEAWARGKRNGQTVPSTDPTYHNNAEYFAQQAATSAAAADQIVFTGNLAPSYSSSAAYQIGDYVMQNDTLYECITAIPSPGEAFNANHWREVMVSDIKEQVDNIIVVNEQAQPETKVQIETTDEDVDIALMSDLTAAVSSEQVRATAAQTTQRNRALVAENLKVNRPLINGQPSDGINGQLLRTKGNGQTEWVDSGTPTAEQVAPAVETWLDEHPEAVTTVNFNIVNKVFNTVADMIADVTLEIGNNVQTNGYHNAGDGGGSRYIIRNSSYGTPNDGLLIELSNGYLAELIIENNIYSAIQFGAYGDMYHDDTSALQLAINSVPDGATILIGYHRIEGQLICNLNNNRQVSLIGTTPTRMNKTGNDKSSMLYFPYADELDDYCIKVINGCCLFIKDLVVHGKDENAGKGIFINEGAIWGNNITIQSFEKGLYCLNTDGSTLQNVCITYCNECFEASSCYNFGIINSAFLCSKQNTGTSYCIKASEGSVINLQNCSIERFTNGVVVGNNAFVNCDCVYFEGLLTDQGSPAVPWVCVKIPDTSLVAKFRASGSHAYLKQGCKFIEARGQHMILTSHDNEFAISEADNTTLCYDIQPKNGQYVALNISGDNWGTSLGINTYLPNESNLGGQINIIYPVGIKNPVKMKAITLSGVSLPSAGNYKYEDSFITPTTKIFIQHNYFDWNNISRRYTTSVQIMGSGGVYYANIGFIDQSGNLLPAETVISINILMIND